MIRKEKKLESISIYCTLIFFFLLAFGYFYWFSDYVLFSQEKQSLLIFSREFLGKYFTKPGGPLEFLGEFLTCFYFHPAIGTFILAIILTLPAVVLYKINQKLFPNPSFSSFFLLIASSLLLLMQTHYYHAMEYNLGYISILGYFLFVINHNRYIAIAVFPLLFYLIGAYIWIFFIMFLIYILLYEKGKMCYAHLAFLVAVGGITLIIFKALFLQPLEEFFQYPLPLVSDSRHRTLFYLLTGYLLLYPIFGKIKLTFKIKMKYLKPVSFVSVLIVFAVTIFIISTLYNPETRKVFYLQKNISENKWKEAIEFNETNPSKNMLGQFFYNIALSETDQLCDRLFFGRQDFGTRSLILPWENEYINWGGYFYYTIGLINEAQRWAYESMVIYGYQPENLKLLVKTNLINGEYRMAEKYLNLLKKSFNYRNWAEEYERLLYKPAMVLTHPELGEKIKLLPKKDFFIQLNDPQNNISLLLNANPDNRKAFEYEIAWYLLSKNVEAMIQQISQMEKLGYDHLPRHVEEAVLVYFNSTGTMPSLGKFTIRKETEIQFMQYVSTYKKMRQNSSWNFQEMFNRFGNTFWFYFHFK